MTKKSFYDSLASQEHLEYLKKFKYPDRISLQLLPTDLKNQIVLDVGCGPSTSLGDVVIERGGFYIALDKDLRSIEAHLEHNSWKVERADITKLPFEDKETNITHSRAVIMHLKPGERIRAIEELTRVGQTNIVIDWDWSTFKAPNQLLKKFIQANYVLAELVGSDLEHGGKLYKLVKSILGSKYQVEERIFNDGPGYYYNEIILLVRFGIVKLQELGREQEVLDLTSVIIQIEKDTKRQLEQFTRPNLVAVTF